MTDLRQLLRDVDVNSDSECYMSAPLFSEAADALDAKDAEIARLREALTAMMARAQSTRGDQAYRELPTFVIRASRAALAGKE